MTISLKETRSVNEERGSNWFVGTRDIKQPVNTIVFTHYPMKMDLTTITTRSIVFKRIETAQLQRSLINKELRSIIAKKEPKMVAQIV